KFAAEFLKVGVGARALGMGGAFTALADDASAIYWNPAGPALLVEPDVQLTHAEMFGGIVTHDVISGALPIGRNGGRSSVGLSVIRLGVDDIKVTSDALRQEAGGLIVVDPDLVRIESAYDLGVFFNYAAGLGEKWSIGGNVKMIRQSLVGDGSSFGIGADLGLLWLPSASTTFGLRLADITTTQIKWDTGRHEKVSPTVTVGGQGTRGIGFLKGTVTLAADVQMAFEDLGEADQFSSGSMSGNLHAGGEYWYNSVVAVRVGTNSGHFAAGAGVRFRLGPMTRFGVDYAFLDHDELDATNRVTLNLGW
ncbi:MAG: hypothetical protein FD129_2592, partial [bacterium]